MKEAWGKPDIVLVTGDMVAHWIAYNPRMAAPRYELLKEILDMNAQLLNEYFPDSIVIPTLGNNDNKVHDEATNTDDKAEFYQFLFDNWMAKMRGNA